MSWSISTSGTVNEIRAEIHKHEETQLRHMPQGERLLAHHALGHALSVAEEHDSLRGAEHRYVLSGYGSEMPSGGQANINLQISLDHDSGD